jgi:hypothetical protein
MEGGSPSLIWERWTLPMYRVQLRYWGDHPTLEMLAAAYFKIPHKKTPPPPKGGDAPAPPAAAVDWSLLDAPMPKFGPAQSTF